MTTSAAQQVVDTMWEGDFYSQWLGLVIDEIREGYCRLHFVIRQDMLNGFGIVHGGVIFSAADSAFAFAGNSHGKLSMALDMSVSFIASAREGETISIEAKEIHLGNRIAFYEITGTNTQGKVVATFKGTAYRTDKDIL
jgi:acyl-CoA thioesterase